MTKGKKTKLSKDFLFIVAGVFIIIILSAFIKSIFFSSNEKKLKYSDAIKIEKNISFQNRQKDNEEMTIPQIKISSDENIKIELPNLPKTKDNK